MFIGFLPELFRIMIHGLPKLVLLVEFTGNTDEEIDGKLKQVAEVAKKFNARVHLATSADEAKEYWTVRRESFNLLRHSLQLSTPLLVTRATVTFTLSH